MSRAIAKYEEFHGRPSKRIDEINFYVPRSMVLIGEAVAIEYRCNKLHGGGDGKRAVYRHEFETPAIVCMDERAKKQLYIIGPQIVVDDRGIRR